MKKGILFVLFTVLFSSLISGAVIEMGSEFQKGELLIAKISGEFNILPTEEKIGFYEKDTPNRIPLSPQLIKINDEWYISVTLPLNSKNYSMIINNVEYKDRFGNFIDDDLIKHFKISNETVDFSMSPGVVSTKKSFSINLQNLRNQRTIINIKIKDIEKSVELIIGESKTINFDLEKVNESVLNYLELESEKTKYKIPVFILETPPEEIEIPGKSFEFIPHSINTSFPTNHSRERIIYLNNTGGQALEEISFFISTGLRDIMSLSVENISRLEKSSMIKMEVSFFSKEEGIFQGHVSAREGERYSYLPIFIEFVKDYSPLNDEEKDPLRDYVFDEGEVIDAVDGYVPPKPLDDSEKKETNLGKTIGWIIVIVVVLIVLWFFIKKYKGVGGRKIDLLKIGKK
jgi:hypothetical protein